MTSKEAGENFPQALPREEIHFFWSPSRIQSSRLLSISTSSILYSILYKWILFPLPSLYKTHFFKSSAPFPLLPSAAPCVKAALRHPRKERGKSYEVLGNMDVSSPTARLALMVLLHLCPRLGKQHDLSLALHQPVVGRGRMQTPRHFLDHMSNRSVYSWRAQ